MATNPTQEELAFMARRDASIAKPNAEVERFIDYLVENECHEMISEDFLNRVYWEYRMVKTLQGRGEQK